jgi:U3 small nucleolar RNA-associated protein 15
MWDNEVNEGEVIAPKGKKQKLQDYDIYLKKFQYHNALDSALQKNNVEIILSLLEELIDRNVLKLALMNRTEDDLILLLNFIKWKIRDPKAINILIYMLELIIEFYMVMLDRSVPVRKLFNEIHFIINEEIKMESELKEINNKIDLLININNY